MAETGTKLREMVEEEAARAEADEETPEPTPESNPPAEEDGPTEEPDEEQAEDEEPAQPSGLNVEQGAELEKATTAYFKRVARVFGRDNMPPECPTCNGLGFDLTGGAPEIVYELDPATAQCDVCKGKGATKTRSDVAGQELRRCERCKGAGYLVVRPVPVAHSEQVAPVVVALAEGNADSAAAVALGPGDPGWEPWMGGDGLTP